MIDVILCCYNQSKYIEKALQGICKQKVNEKINLIVADDCSPDDTLEKIRKYTLPDFIQINILPNKKNLGFIKNYQRAFMACSSKYIFIIEGDDYWTSEDHISNHIHFLEEHSEVSMTMNRLTILNNESHEISYSYWEENWHGHKLWFLEEQIFANRLGNLSACCFRGDLIAKLPKRLFNLYFADWLLGMIMCESGPLAILEKSTSVYRVHPNGQWSRMTLDEQNNELFRLGNIYDKYFGYKYTNEFNSLRNRLGFSIKEKYNLKIKNLLKKAILFFYLRRRKILFCLFILFLIFLIFISPEQIFTKGV